MEKVSINLQRSTTGQSFGPTSCKACFPFATTWTRRRFLWIRKILQVWSLCNHWEWLSSESPYWLTATLEHLIHFYTRLTQSTARDCLRNVIALWSIPAIKKVVQYQNADFQLNDSAEWFFDHAAKFAQPGWIPDQEDILHSRVKTTGVLETTFLIDERRLRLVDVGGESCVWCIKIRPHSVY